MSMNNPEFDQLTNPNHFKNLDYPQAPQAQVSMMTPRGKQQDSSTATTTRPVVTGTPPMMMMMQPPNPSNHFLQGQDAYHHHHQILACGGPPPPQQKQQQPVEISPVYSRSTIVTQHDNSYGVYGGRGTGGDTTAAGGTTGGGSDTNSVISSVTIDDNMELLEPLPIFPNIFDESDDDDDVCTRLGLRGHGDEQQGGRRAQEEAGSNDDGNMPTRISINAHAGIVSRTLEVYQSAGIVSGRSKEDKPPSTRSGGNDNNGCTTVCPAVSQGQEAMLWQMNHQYQMMMGVVQPTLNHQLPHNFLHLPPHHNNNNMYHHHVPSSHCNNMQVAAHEQNQFVGSSVMMPPPLYSYPRPPSYHDANTNNGSTSITNNNKLSSIPETSGRMRVDDAFENDLMKLVPPGAAGGNSAAILLGDDGGGGGDSTTASVESDRFNLDDFLERIFNEYE